MLIDNHIELTDKEYSKLCWKDQEAIGKGNWGSCFNFADLSKFPNMKILDLSKAPGIITMYARQELGINKGRWDKLLKPGLFKARRFPNLEVIKLPSGDITRDSILQAKPKKFKSEREYQEYENNTRQQQGGLELPSLGDSISTIKDLVWSKPLPRILLKTFGYGIGVPMYWGMMTAMGPFGLLMGALGVGALAHQEVKHYKETGSL